MDSRLRDLERRSVTGTVSPQELHQAQIRAGQRLPWEGWPTLKLCYELIERFGRDLNPNVKEYTDKHVHIRWEHNSKLYGRHDCPEPRLAAVWRADSRAPGSPGWGLQLASQVGTNVGWSVENEAFRQHALNLLAERKEEE